MYADFKDENNEGKSIPYLEIYFSGIFNPARIPYKVVDLALAKRPRVSHVLTFCTGEMLRQTNVKPIYRLLYKHDSEIEVIPKSSCLQEFEIKALATKYKDVRFPVRQTNFATIAK